MGSEGGRETREEKGEWKEGGKKGGKGRRGKINVQEKNLPLHVHHVYTI